MGTHILKYKNKYGNVNNKLKILANSEAREKRTELVIGTTESLSSVYKVLLLKQIKN